MKRFKLLFLTTILIFSSLLFAADGGGGGSEEDSNISARVQKFLDQLKPEHESRKNSWGKSLREGYKQLGLAPVERVARKLRVDSAALLLSFSPCDCVNIEFSGGIEKVFESKDTSLFSFSRRNGLIETSSGRNNFIEEIRCFEVDTFLNHHAASSEGADDDTSAAGGGGGSKDDGAGGGGGAVHPHKRRASADQAETDQAEKKRASFSETAGAASSEGSDDDTSAADGGGGGSKEVAAGAADASGASAAPVLAVMHRWLRHPAHGQARELLAKCLLERKGEAPEEAPGTKYINQVEWLGSGKIIEQGLKITPETTYQDLTQAVAAKLEDGTHPYAIRLFNGHGGPDITEDTDIGSLVIETLVVTRDYLKLQRLVMADIYDLLPDGAIKDEALAKLENHPSTWIGARKVSEEGFILKLDLKNNQLEGPIPSELGLLTKLQELFLAGNQLTGEIPVELGQLTGLRELYLHHNQLTGEIPVELGELTELRTLSLSGNRLTGPIPSELGQLTKLRTLYLIITN